MLKKTVICLIVALLGSSLLFAQQGWKGPADGPVRQKKAQGQKPQQAKAPKAAFGRILNALNEAYRKNDREKMGKILKKLNQAHKKMQGRLKDAGPQRMGRQGQNMSMGRPGRGGRMRGMGRQRQGGRGPRMCGRGGSGRGFRRGRGYSGQGQCRFRQRDSQW